jgi:hypothetical protein
MCRRGAIRGPPQSARVSRSPLLQAGHGTRSARCHRAGLLRRSTGMSAKHSQRRQAHWLPPPVRRNPAVGRLSRRRSL